MPLSIINDGYTLDGKLPARGPWPEVKFRYRPALAEDVYEHLNAMRQASGRQQAKAAVDLLGKYLMSWDIEDAKGEVAPVTVENLRRLPQPILAGLVDHVLGYGEAQHEADAKN
jgi:hypothetical protein